MSRIIRVALLVRDYDEAIAFYVGKMGFTLLEDTTFPASEDGKTPARRWVAVLPAGAPPGSTNLVLVKAATEQQVAAVGNQSGGRVFLFLGTDDFDRDYKKYSEAGCEWVRPPVKQPYGTVAVFKDIYGNMWDLIGPAEDKDEESDDR
ncbi:glyoxalase/bleomycin resistance protein/dioxygenase [Microdochium trichocladiopsis]|uniref:Glyoxalase/bleomycin resistance protein/dioxygenase n=1 Tax=Microdochium trichocladiopsis TaxID=1682393 RepID=A0A9P8XZ41_9PEZI|nr:glyoxalase/bleomycin resistance protein/dioxygenase [Microdochium trichocladiopsis]KAH7025819.1 glyoxalase/bleomycin resistance protein/dioxygenase [Microdochium trichocladiopsis]